MATYDLEEQEKLDELKTWWKINGWWVSLLMVALAVAALGWQAWNYWRNEQSAAASALYATITDAAASGNAKAARDAAGVLIEKYAQNDYAALGVLLAAKIQSQENTDNKTAITQLGWAADHAKDVALRDLARLRLAALLLDDKQFDAALARLTAEPLPAFAPRFFELKGDIALAQNDKKAARAAWEQALTRYEALKSAETGWASGYGEMLRNKIDAMGGGAA